MPDLFYTSDKRVNIINVKRGKSKFLKRGQGGSSELVLPFGYTGVFIIIKDNTRGLLKEVS